MFFSSSLRRVVAACSHTRNFARRSLLSRCGSDGRGPDAATFASAVDAPRPRVTLSIAERGRLTRSIGKRARALRRAHRGASLAAASLLASEVLAGECAEEIAACSAAMTALDDRIGAMTTQRRLLSGLFDGCEPLRVAATHWRSTLGPRATARLRLDVVESRIELFARQVDDDAARRRLTLAQQSWSRARDRLQRRIRRLRLLQRSRVSPREVPERVALEVAMRV